MTGWEDVQLWWISLLFFDIRRALFSVSPPVSGGRTSFTSLEALGSTGAGLENPFSPSRSIRRVI